MFYLTAFLLLCFTCWMLTHKRARERAPLPQRHRLVLCEYCHFAYLGEAERISRCPECHQLNDLHTSDR